MKLPNDPIGVRARYPENRAHSNEGARLAGSRLGDKGQLARDINDLSWFRKLGVAQANSEDGTLHELPNHQIAGRDAWMRTTATGGREHGSRRLLQACWESSKVAR